VPLHGMSSLALLAITAPGDGAVAAAVSGGHGELFVQQFDGSTLEPSGDLLNLAPAAAAASLSAELVVGTGAAPLVAARGWGEARQAWPVAADAPKLPERLRTLAARPVYARAPDAKVPVAA